MANAKLKFDGKEIALDRAISTLGRASDNTVACLNDANVSRYHAEIEERSGEFWLIELGSSNGTTINGEDFDTEKLLEDGDVILLGGSSKVEFLYEKESAEKDEEKTASTASPQTGAIPTTEKTETAEAAPAAGKFPWILGVMGAVCGLAIVFVAAAVLFSYFRTTPKCEAVAKITKPENQDTISESTDVEVEIENGDCVTRAIFLLNGVAFGDAAEQPFKATLDPKQFPELADGSLLNLQIVLEDTEGNKIVQPGEVLLALETVEIATPTPTPIEIAENPTPKSTGGKGKISLVEMQKIADTFIKQLAGNTKYTLDKEFLDAVQKKTADYASGGYFARASLFKEVINKEFVREQALEARLGFVLAMSRSQFKLEKQGADEGLWRMTNDFAAANSYNVSCETPSLSDQSQKCAAMVAANYLKALNTTVFEGDVIYEVAAFGKSALEASQWKSTLPADRSNFWNVIKDAKQREEIVRFFAAGIVAENPQKFGLKNDRPISELYQ